MTDESKPRPKPTKVRQKDFSPGTYKLFRQAGFITRDGYLKGTEPTTEPSSKKRNPAARDPNFWYDFWHDLFVAVRLEACYQVLKHQWPTTPDDLRRDIIARSATAERIAWRDAELIMQWNPKRRFA